MKYVNLKNYIDTLESGKRPKGGASNNGIPSLGGEHINSFGGFNLDKEKMKYVPKEYFNSLKKGLIENKDILIVKDGATTGKVAYVDDEFPLKKACINEHVFKISTKDKLNPKYLFYFLYSDIGQHEVLNDFRGATVGGISKNFIDINMYIPDITVQAKIIKLLDKAQELIDKRKAQIEDLDELVKSRFIEMFGDPVKNEKNWDIGELGKIGNWQTGGTPSRNNLEYFKGNIPWLSSGELNNIYCFDSNEYITEEAIKNSSAKLIEKGSLLLGMYDTAALKSTINQVNCSCNQAIAYAKLKDEVNTIFVYYWC